MKSMVELYSMSQSKIMRTCERCFAEFDDQFSGLRHEKLCKVLADPKVGNHERIDISVGDFHPFKMTNGTVFAVCDMVEYMHGQVAVSPLGLHLLGHPLVVWLCQGFRCNDKIDVYKVRPVETEVLLNDTEKVEPTKSNIFKLQAVSSSSIQSANIVHLVATNNQRKVGLIPYDLNTEIAKQYKGLYLRENSEVVADVFGNLFRFKVVCVNDHKTPVRERNLSGMMRQLSLNDSVDRSLTQSIDYSSDGGIPKTSTPVSYDRSGGMRDKKSRIKSVKRNMLTLYVGPLRIPKFNVFVVTPSTKFAIIDPINSSVNDASQIHKNPVMFCDIGGLENLKFDLGAFIIRPLKLLVDPKEGLKQKLSMRLLLYGLGGCGKSILLEALANEVENLKSSLDIVTSLTVIRLNASNLHPGKGDSKKDIEGILTEWFENALESSPALITIDNFEALSNSSKKENCGRTFAVFNQLLDRIEGSNIFVIAATNQVESVNSSVRRRFDVELECSAPNAKERLVILRKLLLQRFEEFSKKLTDQNLTTIASRTHAFTGADLVALCKQAFCSLLRSSAENASNESGDSLGVFSLNDFENALCRVRPSAMREIVMEIPKVLWTDIGGLASIKEKLCQAVEWPLKHQDALLRMGIKPPCGVLLYGPPGCSKTMIARALATESELNFVAVKGPELFSKWVGESERAVREVFRKARQAAPSIIFFDEIDALAGQRGSSGGDKGAGSGIVGDRVLTQLLTELDGVEPLTNVCVIAATNRPDVIDSALLRPGRLDRLLYITLPDTDARKEILSLQFRKCPVNVEVQERLDELAERTAGYTGAELVAVVNEAAYKALSEDIEAVTISWNHIESATRIVTPRTQKQSLELFDQFGSSGVK